MSWSRTQNALAVMLLMCFCCNAATTVVRDVTVISPERAEPLEHAYVGIENGRITAVSTQPLKGDLQIDGRGKFLIPGLIDSHTHLREVPGMNAAQLSAHTDLAAEEQAQEPRSYLYFGFTTVLSLGDTAPPIARWNALAVRPDAYFCGGTPVANGYSFRGFTESPYFLFDADQAAAIPASVDKAQHTPQRVVERMKHDGAICVKSYRESGFGADAGRLPVPSVGMIRAVVAAAHAHGMPVFLHANSMAAQQFAVEAGVDVIAHGMWNGHQSRAGALDKGVEPILQTILMRGMGYQPTAQVIRGLGAVLDDRFFADPLVSRVYSPRLIAWYRSPEGGWFAKGEPGDTPPAAFEQVGGYGDVVTGYLAQHNARLLFGTDTPSAPIYTNPPGLNGFYEMRRWIAAGVSTRQLFRAATIDNARTLHLERDIGSIETGKRAHLLLLRANPLKSVEAYNTIETVFLAGKAIPRETLAVPTVAAAVIANGKPNFSGNWKINMAKSDFGPVPPAPSFVIRATHSDPSLTIVQEHGIEDDNSTRTLTIGGKEIAFESRGAHVTTKVVWEGGMLAISSNVKGDGFEVLRKSTWSLADGGKTLRIIEHGKTPGGDYEMTLVFDKQ